MRSGLPSPFTSAAATETGSAPAAKVCWAAKEGVVAPGAVVFSSTDTVLELIVGDDEVGPAVAVDVRRRHGVGRCRWRRSAGRRRGGGGARRRRVQQHRHRVVES